MAMRDCRIHTAYHEAGHVVVVYWYGWWLNADGVEIDTRSYTETRSPALLYTTEARVVMLMAGRIAEHKYHGLDNARFDDDSGLEVLEVVRRIHHGEEILVEEWDWSGDCTDIAVVLVEEKRAITDHEYVRALRTYQKKTRLILNKPAAVKKVTEALLEAGRLTDAQARAAIAGEDIFGKGSTQTLRAVGLDADFTEYYARAYGAAVVDFLTIITSSICPRRPVVKCAFCPKGLEMVTRRCRCYSPRARGYGHELLHFPPTITRWGRRPHH
jgi:hypothetical protein